MMRNLVRRVLQRLTYSSRPKARTARIASGRLADENPRFSGKRNLMCRVPGSLMYFSRPKARTARIASRRLADENPRFSGMRNLA